MATHTIGFLGTGRMATALALGFVRSGKVVADCIWGSDPVLAAREAFGRELGARVTDSNRQVVQNCDLVFLSVKPDQVGPVLDDVHGDWKENTLLISIAAGVSLSDLQSDVPETVRVIRVMPNTPALVGASASAYALGTGATEADSKVVGDLLESVGMAIRVKEGLLDGVTGLSGSGPAYGFLVIEALADGGVAAGLPRDVAQRLAAQTLLGAARMVLETGQHPGALKDAVCSPGGTTIEGIHALERAGVRAAFMDAVRAAARRAQELG
jgi:pyrroline-5-carboxylate reductase